MLIKLETSLKTCNIEWMYEFLNHPNEGLNVLVDYLSERLLILRHNQSLDNQKYSENLDRKRVDKLLRRSKKLKMGKVNDDIHIGIMCLRAIMAASRGYGSSMVIQHCRYSSKLLYFD